MINLSEKQIMVLVISVAKLDIQNLNYFSEHFNTTQLL